ncbi:MAG: PQQ-binding-like beta-propeller repeat protein [Thermoplasmata archaeon]
MRSQKILTLGLVILLVLSGLVTGSYLKGNVNENRSKEEGKQNSMVVKLKPGKQRIVDLSDGGKIVYSRCSEGTAPGKPALPVRHYKLLLQPGTDISSVSVDLVSKNQTVLKGDFFYKPTPPPASSVFTPNNVSFNQKSGDIYNSDSFWPNKTIESKGVHKMRDAVILALDYYPIQFNPVKKDIKKNEDVKIKIEWDKNPVESIDKLTHDFISSRRKEFDNYQDMESMYDTSKIQDTTSSPSSTYVIVTTNEIEDSSDNLAKYRQFIESQGHQTKIITEDEYGTATGEERVFNIRQWLKNNYESMPIEYVLLVGDPDPYNIENSTDEVGDVPMLMCWPRKDESSYRNSPTDYIYADLTGDWDLNDDGYYGDYNNDQGTGGVDFNPELYVGRIPVYNSNYSALDDIFQNIMEYPDKDGQWKERVLEPMAISNYENEDDNGWPRTDGLNVPEHLFDNILNDTGMKDTVMYERSGLEPVPSSAFHYDMGVSKSNFTSEFNDGYGIVLWWAHGGSEGAWRKYWSSDDGDGIPEEDEMTWSDFISSPDMSNLEKDAPAFFYQSSCYNGYPEHPQNLGYTLLKRGAAVSTVSSTRVSWYRIGTWNPEKTYSDNTALGYYYLDNLLELNLPAGKALFDSKSSGENGWAGQSWMNKMDFNLYGDPQMNYWSDGLDDTPWPMFGHDLNHTSRSPYDTSHVDGTLRWNFSTGDRVMSSPAIGHNGTIYVGSNDGDLYGINPDGTKKWSYHTGDQVRSSPAIGSDGTIYVGCRDGNLYALNANGTEKWSFPTGGEVDSSPAIGSDGTIYVGGGDTVYGIYPDGTEKWNFTCHWVRSSPAIGADGTIYVGSGGSNLYALNSNGTEKWSFPTGGEVDSSPAIGSDGTIYVGCRDSNLYAVNSDGTEKWRYNTGDRVRSSPAIGADGTIYVGSWDDNLYAINPNGTEKWNFTAGNHLNSSPAIGSDGTIYVCSDTNHLYAINPNGTEKWSFPTGGNMYSSPAIGSDGTIYVGSEDSNLYALTGGYDIDLTAGGLSEGWNFVSTPYVPHSKGIQSILNDPANGIEGNYDKVLYYVTEGDEWMSFIPGRDNFNDDMQWDETKGLWIRMNTDDMLTVEGTEPETPEITLKPGWNMVGYPSATDRLASDTLPSEVTKIGVFNASREYNLEYIYDLSNYTMKAGEGYWVYNDADYSVDWSLTY